MKLYNLVFSQVKVLSKVVAIKFDKKFLHSTFKKKKIQLTLEKQNTTNGINKKIIVVTSNEKNHKLTNVCLKNNLINVNNGLISIENNLPELEKKNSIIIVKK